MEHLHPGDRSRRARVHRRRAVALTPAIFALLLALLDGERHGYALMREVGELTDGVITLGPGTLYRSLQRMRVDGLIEELDDPVDETADRRSERRRSYRITPAGRLAARQEAERLAILLSAAARSGLGEEGAPR